MPSVPTSRSVPRRLLVVAAAWLLLSAVVAAVLINNQRDTRAEINDRFGQRPVVASRFVSTYVDGIVAHEREQGRAHLAGRHVTAAMFDRVAQDGGFGAAVLLDGKGRLLEIYPRKPDLIGQVLTGKYEHLREAVAGKVSVSKVVPSAATGTPIVGFAVPFDTPQGRRVYSGAQEIGKTTAGSYLRNAVTVPGAKLYLVDPSGVIIAKNGAPAHGVEALSKADPSLARALAHHGEGDVGSGRTARRYASAPIPQTSWRIVVTVPSALLYSSISGRSRWVPWLVFGGFVLVSLLAFVLIGRVLETRRQLAESARIDPLTGLVNRRGLDEHLGRAVSAARRRHVPLTVMLVDVDHFKRINDTHGHQAGDLVLAELGRVMDGQLRGEDLVGRWGGEEFIVVLETLDSGSAEVLAERLRVAIADHAFATGPVTVSIGVATAVDATIDERIRVADRALYAAKDGGRNRVVLAPAGVPIPS